MILGGIDPGKHVSYLSRFDNGVLHSIYWGDPPYGQYFDVLHVEVPHVYPGVRAENPNDLIEVARGLERAICAQKYGELVEYRPREWKGTIKKRVMTRRIQKILTASGEIKVLESQGLENDHNVLDSCGIVLYALGRLNY